MAVVMVFDLVEDHRLLALLAVVDGSIVFSLFCYGIAIPRTTRLGWRSRSSGTLFTAVVGCDFGSLDRGRWIDFLMGSGLACAWLRTAPDPDPGTMRA